MNYLSKFDSNGKRITSYPLDDMLTDDKRTELIADGYVEISEEDWNYYVGNHGSGKNGTGYIRGKDGKPTDAPTIVVTDDEKKSRALEELDSQYKADKSELSTQYLDAAMVEDTDTMDAIKSELAALNAKYDANYAALNKAQ